MISFWLHEHFHCVKSLHIRSFSGPYFPAFGLNTEYLSAFSPNAGKYGQEKLRIRILKEIDFVLNSFSTSSPDIFC